MAKRYEPGWTRYEARRSLAGTLIDSPRRGGAKRVLIAAAVLKWLVKMASVTHIAASSVLRVRRARVPPREP